MDSLMGLVGGGRGAPRRSPGPGASVQEAYVGAGLVAVRHGAAALADGSCRAVIEVGGIDLLLRSQGEQEATLAGFAAFLNALAYPVQLLARLVPVDLEPCAARLEDRALRVLGEPLAGIALDHAAFVRRLGRRRDLLERRYFVVVPGDPAAVPDAGGWPRLLGLRFGRGRGPGAAGAPGEAVPTAAQRRQLAARCAEVAQHLARCDLPVSRLDDGGLAALLYACWCPDLSRVQRLRGPLPGLTAPVVRAAPPSR